MLHGGCADVMFLALRGGGDGDCLVIDEARGGFLGESELGVSPFQGVCDSRGGGIHGFRMTTR